MEERQDGEEKGLGRCRCNRKEIMKKSSKRNLIGTKNEKNSYEEKKKATGSMKREIDIY